jgi:DNA-binding CsgD family transcriptional regulator
VIKDDVIRKIKLELSKNITCRDIGREFNISEKTISRIKRGKRYIFIK